MESIEIRTDRLILRDHKMEDLADYHRMISNPKNMYYLPDLMSHSLEDTESSFQDIIEDSRKETRKWIYLGLFLKDFTYVGEIGYSVTSVDSSGNKQVNLGYFIREEFWNKGITSEAVKALVEFAFRKDKVIKIELGCITENVASEKVMIKCGFKKVTCKKKHSRMHSRWMDRVEYAMTLEEFNSH